MLRPQRLSPLEQPHRAVCFLLGDQHHPQVNVADVKRREFLDELLQRAGSLGDSPRLLLLARFTVGLDCLGILTSQQAVERQGR